MLKRKRDGHYLISSASHVAAGLRALEEKRNYLEGLKRNHFIDVLEEEIAQLDADIKAFVLDSEDYEDDDYKLTRVQGHRRVWDVSVLERVVPRGIFKNIVTMTADPQKIDQYVRDGKLKLKQIRPALTETANAPYIKITKKQHNEERGATEAAALTEAMQ